MSPFETRPTSIQTADGNRTGLSSEHGDDAEAARAWKAADFPHANVVGTRLCLTHDDDAGTRYHLERVVECVRAAAKTFRELDALNGRVA